MAYLDDRRATARYSRVGRAMGLGLGVLPGRRPTPPLHGDDEELAHTPLVDLTAQLNRFRDSAPAVVPLDTVASGNLTQPVASKAVGLHLARLLTAIPDSQTLTAIGKATAATANPIPFVAANMAMLTQSIQGYADAKGLPSADYHRVPPPGTPFGLPVSVLALGAVGVLGAFWFFGKRRR